MIAIPDIPGDATAAEVCELCRRRGWREIGVGDWSRVLGRDDSPWALRVTPFDPAYRMFAEACAQGPANRWLPRVVGIRPLRRDGYVTLIERLWPADEPIAGALCVALGIPNDSGYEILGGPKPFEPAEADLVEARRRIRALLDEGRRRFALWGGSDIRPGNILKDAEGQLKVVDPIFLRGPSIVEAIRQQEPDRLTDFSRAQLEDFLTIPVFKPGPETDELRAAVAALFAP
jgi:hypothetical protein